MTRHDDTPVARGHRAVRKGSAHTRAAQGMGTRGIRAHQANPAKPVHVDELAVARAYRIAVDARRGDHGASSALDRLVEARHRRTRGREGSHEQVQQDAAGAQTQPGGAIQDAVIGLEVR